MLRLAIAAYLGGWLAGECLAILRDGEDSEPERAYQKCLAGVRLVCGLVLFASDGRRGLDPRPDNAIQEDVRLFCLVWLALRIAPFLPFILLGVLHMAGPVSRVFRG